ncbi:hypothetical protein [Bradyrhizobium sp. BR 1433]|uniref:hypothetical protein n=1 Tax=Bradyrhizobium sp. BR 1433 TaxID=3447967 RepID=UPI003EE786AA
MTQLEIAALAVAAFGLFMFGYSLGWMQRGRMRQRPHCPCSVVEADLEQLVRRSQR